METKIIEQGTFSKVGNEFFPKNFHTPYIKYLILERKHQLNKPKFYIIAKFKGNDIFISSLYPMQQKNQFKIEYKKEYFTLTIEENQVLINPYFTAKTNSMS